MLELRLFGAVDLRHRGGAPLGGLLAQPKRIALLAFVAAEGTRRRDTLLGVLWPEAEPARARGALNRAVYVLRRELGGDVLQSHGDGLMVDGARLWCDVAAFDAALAEGRREDALELYRGELLAGFYVDDAPEFERWVDRERERLRERARAAAMSLADEAEARGELDAALAWVRRALAVAPDDERAVRREMGLRGDSGDRAGALRVYEAFSRRLADELGALPSPQTRALADALRAREHGPSVDRPAAVPHADPVVPVDAEPSPVPASQPDRPSPSTGEGSASPVRRRLFISRRTAVVGVCVALLAAVGAWWRSGRGALDSSTGTVAVVPFRYTGAPELAYLSAGIGNLLAPSLAESGIHAVPAGEAGAPATRAAAEAIARRLGAGRLLTGEIVEANGQLRIRARIFDASAGAGEPREVSVEGDAKQVFALVDRLAAQLAPSPAAARTDARSATVPGTRSPAAIAAYLQGEQDFRAGRYALAAQGFRQAIAADSGFALAYLRLSTAANWTGESSQAVWGAAQAFERRASLPALERLRVEAWSAYLSGDAPASLRLHRALVSAAPGDPEGWFYLAETEFHWGALLGTPPARSREAFVRVAAMQPDNAGALIHLARIAAGDRDGAEFDRLAARLRALGPEAEVEQEIRMLRAFAFGGAADRTAALNGLMSAGTLPLRDITLHTLAHAADPADAAGALLPRVRDRSGSSADYGVDALLLAQAEAGAGRLSRADRALADGARFFPARTVEYGAMLRLLPLVPSARAELRTRRTALTPAPAEDFGWERGQPLRLYLRALLSLRLGDTAEADRLAAALERFRGKREDTGAFARAYARLVRAEAARAAGRSAEALALLGAPQIEANHRVPSILSYPRAHERFLRGELLAALGRPAEALAWYETFPDPAAYDLAYLAPAQFRRAEMLERLGRRTAAAAAFERFAALWRTADPALQPRVAEAKERAAALRRLGPSGDSPSSPSRSRR